jgi:hypothetical protein
MMARSPRAPVPRRSAWSAMESTGGGGGEAAAPAGGPGRLAERERRALGAGTDNDLTARRHLELLRQAGFGAAGSVWQYGHSCVLAAVRASPRRLRQHIS